MSDSESTLHTRPSLLMRLRDPADGTAWQAFVAIYAPLLYHWCIRKGLQDADAADVSQEALLQVARSIRTFEYQPQRGRFRDWLGVIIRRRLSRFREQQGRVAVVGSIETEQTLAQADAVPADAEWTAEFNAQVLRVALEKIRPEFEATTWMVFEQTWLVGQSAAGAAALASLSIQAAYVAKHRVLKRLEEEVCHLAEDLPQCVPLHRRCPS